MIKKNKEGETLKVKPTQEKKIFVLDTNVPLFDPRCTRKFQENDISIPVCSIGEIDRFKTGLESINLNAREFTRQLDAYSADVNFNGGVSLGKGLGNLKIELNRPFHEKVKANLYEETVDNQIINIAYSLMTENPNKQVVLVSKDTNVRLKAKALGIMAQDFLSEKVESIKFLSEEVKTLKLNDSIVNLLRAKNDVEYFLKSSMPNQNLILQGSSGQVLARYLNGKLIFVDQNSYSFNVKPKNFEQAFAMNVLLDPSIEVVTIEGGAGTGKTIMSLACGFEQINQGLYNQIIFSRKLVTVGKDMGFMPGDVKEKMSPYMAGMNDTLDELKSIIAKKNKSSQNKNRESKDLKQLTEWVDDGTLSVGALSFIRGRSVGSKFYITDEAQNLTPLEVKTTMTRAGFGTKMIFTGDIHQIDDPYLDERSNGFSYLMDKYKGQENYAHISLKKGERSHLATQAAKLL